MKITSKIVNKILDDFKELLSIKASLKKHNVSHYDFFDYLDGNPVYLNIYEKIERYNAIIEEDMIKDRALNGIDKDSNLIFPSEKIASEMIKAKNPKRYNQKIEIKQTTKIEEMSTEDLIALINLEMETLNKPKK